MYTSIIYLPFLAAIFSGLFGRMVGVKGVYILNITCLLITTILSFIAFYEVILCNSPVSIELYPWINIEHLKVTWSFYFDELTVSMLIPVLIVSLLVHIYSIGYMGEDPHQQRFFSYISLFTGLMLVLVTGNNFLVMFLGWEGVGVCSYLLVHFWYTRIAAVKSAMNAMFTNRVGDFFLTIGFFTLFFTFGTLDYATIFSLAPHINVNVITFIAILLLLGAAAKSAQLGQVKALVILILFKYFIYLIIIRTLIYAGKISNTLEFDDPIIKDIDPKQFQRQGINQQEKNELILKKTDNLYNKEFLTWFIGFTEGDGSFYITGGKSIFSIHLHLADLSLLYEIQTELNMGSVCISKKKNSALFTIKAKKEIENLIDIFNGNIFIKKKQTQFENWVLNYNSKNKCNIKIKTNNFYPSLDNSWLSGFIDAEGSFHVSVSKNKILQRFVLGQTNAKEEFMYLSKLLDGYYEEYKDANRLIINYLKTDLLISYLKNYRLHSIKYKSFQKWMEIYTFRKNNKNFSDIDYKIIKKKASLINQLRKIPS